jgi:hypothetical protein
LFRQNIESLGNNMAALKLNHRSAYQDIVTQQKARLSQRASSIAPDLGVFIPAKGGIPDNSSTALTTGLIQAGLSGASAFVGAGAKYGFPGQGGGGGVGGGSAPMPFSERGGSQVGNSFPVYTGMGSTAYSGIPTFQF